MTRVIEELRVHSIGPVADAPWPSAPSSSGWWTLPGEPRLAHQLGPEGDQWRSRCVGGRRGHRTTGWQPERPGQPRCAECTALVGYATVADLVATGISYRQLDYWSRAGLLRSTNPDPGSGRSRAYPPDEVRVARVMGRLTAAGVTPEAAARVARTGQLAPDLTVLIDPIPDEGDLIMGKNLSLSGALPNSESANGWLDQVNDLLKEPSKTRIAIVQYDVDSIKHKVSTDTDMATVRIRAIEPITDTEKAKQISLVMGDIREQRTGERELELEFDSDTSDGE